MEKLIQKLKNTGTILFVLSLLSVTWLFLDYMALKDIWAETGAQYSYRWLMIIISGAILILLHIWIFATVYYIFRVKMKFKQEQKALQKKKEQNNKMLTENTNTDSDSTPETKE